MRFFLLHCTSQEDLKKKTELPRILFKYPWILSTKTKDFPSTSRFDEYRHNTLEHGSPNFLSQKAIPVIVVWFTDRTW